MPRSPARPAAARSRADRLRRLQGKPAQSGHFDVVLDPVPVEAAREALTALERARLFQSNPEGIAAAEATWETARAAARAAVERLELVGLPRDAYEHLQGLYPPDEAGRKADQAYDLDGFLPALIAATVVEDPATAPAVHRSELGTDPDAVLPGRLMSPAEVADTIAPWNQAEVALLWNAALAVCTQARNAALPFD